MLLWYASPTLCSCIGFVLAEDRSCVVFLSGAFGVTATFDLYALAILRWLRCDERL